MEFSLAWRLLSSGKGQGQRRALGALISPELAARKLLRAQGLCPTQLGLGEKALGVQSTPPPLRKKGVHWGASKDLGTSCYLTPQPQPASHWDGIKGLVPLATAGSLVFHRVQDGLGGGGWGGSLGGGEGKGGMGSLFTNVV